MWAKDMMTSIQVSHHVLKPCQSLCTRSSTLLWRISSQRIVITSVVGRVVGVPVPPILVLVDGSTAAVEGSLLRVASQRIVVARVVGGVAGVTVRPILVVVDVSTAAVEGSLRIVAFQRVIVAGVVGGVVGIGVAPILVAVG